VEQLRLMTWNLHGSGRPRLDAVTDLVQAHEPDIVVFQEVRKAQARRIAALLGWRGPEWAFKHNPLRPLWWRAEGLAVLARYRLAPHPPVVLTPGVSRRSYRRRVVLATEVVLSDDRRLLVLDVHLASDEDDDDVRQQQVDHIASILPDSPPALIAGDLNAPPGAGPVERLVAAGFVDGWAVANPDRPKAHGFTSPANAPRERIDYVLARELTVTDATVVADLGPAMAGLSDHRPLLVTVTWGGDSVGP
jgi:endonuclease/exonuclease/phosphatase family metal-dependent hydrolase